jgi:hypothetical protein
MKQKKLIQISGSDFAVKLPVAGNMIFELNFGGAKLEIAGAVCGGFGEQTAMTEKFRSHRTDDGLTAVVDSVRVVPFGCEYLIQRKIELTSGYAAFTVDVRAGARNALRRLELDPVVLRGDWVSVGVRAADGAAAVWTELGETPCTVYDSGEPFLGMTARDRDGRLIDLGCGFDLWRHRSGSASPGGNARFSIRYEAGQLRIERCIFDYAAETEVCGRLLRLEYFVAWSVASEPAVEATAAVVGLASLELPSSGRRTAADGSVGAGCCMMAAAIRRRLLLLVRSAAAGKLVLAGIEPGVCHDAGHLERANQRALPHWDLPELFTFHRWANRQLAKREGGSFAMTTAPDSRLAGTASQGVLGRPLDKIEVS